MAVIYRSEIGEDGKPEVTVHNMCEGAETGRWCLAPQVPDRCYKCFDSKTMRQLPAQGYREERDGDKIWRYGTCRRCSPGMRLYTHVTDPLA